MATEQRTLVGAAEETEMVEVDHETVAGNNVLIETRGQQAEVRTCQACGSHVSKDYARVQGDNDGNVWACPSCSDRNERLRGAAGYPDHDDRLGESL